MSNMSADDSVSVGVIGLGMMGRPMAVNILNSGAGPVHITGRSRDRYSDLVAAGAEWHDTPRSLAGAARVLLLMLPDLPQVEEVLAGPDGILASEPEDLLLIIASSSSPVGVRELGMRLARTTAGAVRVVDAPVSGGVEGAEAGTLSIMVGGEERDVADAWAVLSACGNPVHLGPLGSGQVAKACNQMIVASTILALGEAAVLAERSGLDLAELFRLLGGGYAGQPHPGKPWRPDHSGGLQSLGRSEVHGQGPRLRFGRGGGDRHASGLVASREGRVRGTHGARARRQRHRRHETLHRTALRMAPGPARAVLTRCGVTAAVRVEKDDM